MNYRLMFIINAVVAAAVGLMLLISPVSLFGFFDMAGGGGSLSHALLARFYGGTLILIAVLLWFLQNTKKETMKTESFAMMVLYLAGAVMTVIDLTSKTQILRAYAWIILLIYLALAAGYAYIIFGVTVKVKSKK